MGEREPDTLAHAQTRVQEVPQGIAQHIEGQHHDADGQAGEECMRL